MQYLLSVIDHRTGSGTPEEAADIDVFNDRLVAEGHWVFAGGLDSPSTATVIDNRDGAGMITDGPFAETKEHVAGFWIIDAPDLDVALKLANDGSKACNRRVEVRPFLRP
jgi:hypothetical protein